MKDIDPEAESVSYPFRYFEEEKLTKEENLNLETEEHLLNEVKEDPKKTLKPWWKFW